MAGLLRNVIAAARANLILGWNALLGKCRYHILSRVFGGASIQIDRGGRLYTGKDVAFGRRTLCAVRRGAVLRMGSGTGFNDDCKIVCRERVEIGDGTIFGPNVMIYDHDHLYSPETGVVRREYRTGEIIIGRNCWIGAGAIILRGTHIGDNCLIGAGSVVKGDFPSGTKIIQKRELLGSALNTK